jgi:hypothetical protein
MKIYKVDSSGQLVKAQTGAGNVQRAEWTVCYKINDDGTGVDIAIEAKEGEHRGTNEINLFNDLFAISDASKSLQQSQGEMRNGAGFGDDEPPDDPSAGVVDTVREEQRADIARQQEVVQEGPETA